VNFPLSTFAIALVVSALGILALMFILATVLDTIEDAWHRARHWHRIDRSHRHTGHHHSRWP
jgi:uncharacterized membrane protein